LYQLKQKRARKWSLLTRSKRKRGGAMGGGHWGKGCESRRKTGKKLKFTGRGTLRFRHWKKKPYKKKDIKGKKKRLRKENYAKKTECGIPLEPTLKPLSKSKCSRKGGLKSLQ